MGGRPLAVQDQLDRRVHRTLRWVAWGGVVVFGAAALTGPVTWQTDDAIPLALFMAAVGTCYAVVLPAVHRGWLKPRLANAALAVLLILGVATTYLSADGMDRPELVLSFGFELIATALLVLSWRAFAAVASVVLLAWAALAQGAPAGDTVEWSVFLGAAFVFAILAHATRLHAARRVETLLADNEAKRRELERALDELKLRQREAVTREKLSALGTLVAGVAHEINNPLTYMRGNVELVQLSLEEGIGRGGIPAEEARALHAQQSAVLRGIDRIEHIAKGLRQVARSHVAVKSAEDVNALIETVLVVGAPRLAANVEVKRELRATQRIPMNAGDMSQVMLNLVLNAGEAMGERGTLTLRTRDEADAVVIEVDDTGPGVPLAIRDKLFTPFFTTKPSGTGLGLSISHQIVEEHDGRIEVDDAPGGGARFRVVLPTAPRAKTSPLHAQGS